MMIGSTLLQAEVNHSLAFEQISDELIEKFNIKQGSFDSVKRCKYEVPSYLSVGRVFFRLVISVYESVNKDDLPQGIINVFSSFINDEISNFNSAVYYANSTYLFCSYKERKLSA